MTDQNDENTFAIYSGEENWSRYIASKCRKWNGYWSVFDPENMELARVLQIIKRCRSGEGELNLEHTVEEDLTQAGFGQEDDKFKSELNLMKEEAMQLKGPNDKEKKFPKPYISIKTKAGIFQHLSLDADQEVMLSWDLRCGDFKCYQFTFRRAGISHTLCYVHDSDWVPVLVTVLEEVSDARDLQKLETSVHRSSYNMPPQGEWKGHAKFLSISYGRSASLESTGLSNRDVSIRVSKIGPLAYSWGSDDNKEISFSNGMSLSIPAEPLKIIGGEFQVGCQWIASEHEIRQIIVDYNNYLVNEMQSLTYRRKDVHLYV
ncbi:uncharacterized protein LOC142338598 isoform X2 [Convolutriloba macropyga]|uniref:uncharacterized protein LOC142338598 isoform X2 n=1 Tax=Convolutriloba macropyga TaxID=536237 RepID=UPI003F52442F